MAKQKTTVGEINKEVLAFTAGRDVELDCALITVDCIGTAAHVTMLSRMPVNPKLITDTEKKKVIEGLVEIIELARQDAFKITLADQDVHLAVERALTKSLGDLGKKIHTCRSRNDQVAVDLRLYAKEQILDTLEEAAELISVLAAFGKKHEKVPMVGRTHMQPGMPSSVGLWATAHAESLLDDCVMLINAYELNDQCPLGSAASYGVPLPIDRQLTSDLLGFSRPTHNVLYANNGRGKMEAIVLGAMSQVMLSLSRLAQDFMLFTMPEFDYFKLPAEFCTGSSIMPQKQNPDVCELVRAKASRVKAAELGVYDLVKGSPTGYNRDLQEAKELFMEGIATTRACLRIMAPLVKATKANKQKLI
ncbi:MAG: argininosuccinate lyase, partial [Kiritimatiellales bacterium]|nr:argininosuccinate lyase [Kiritimatiellales bacterium]